MSTRFSFINEKIYSPTFREDGISEKIKSFGNLPVGWDYGDGVPASPQVINKSIQIYNFRLIFQSFKANARPTTDGGIIVTLFIKDHFLDIVINPDLTMDLRYEIGIGENYDVENEEDNVDENEIFKYLSIIKGKCILLELYTSENMQMIKNDLVVIVSRATMDYQSSQKNVQEQPAIIQSVRILDTTIQTQQESHQFIAG